MSTYSLAEIDALSKKASRGAGYSWGIAEEVGKAVRWLSAYNLKGAEMLAMHLELVADKSQRFIPVLKQTKFSKDTFVFESTEESLCPLYCGTVINDLGHHLKNQKEIAFHNMLQPLLALPSVGRVAEAYNASISFAFEDINIICSPNGIILKDTPPLFGTFSNDKYDVVCSRVKDDFNITNTPAPEGREISKEALKILEHFAHKTYAPATEESRLKGAG